MNDSKTMPKTLLLVDGSSYLYRAFHAMPDLRAVPGDPTSLPTGAIRGMINMLQKLRKDVQADYAACVFDAKGPTFRDAIYPDYKGHRSPMPDDLRAQIEPIHEVVRLMGWKVLDVPGVEADDVIGTLAVTAARQGIEVIVSSGDKDLAQLVNSHITIIDTMNGRRRDVAGVEEEFGVPPHLMVDFQTLVGDAIDNVPGVPKVGPKTAAKWLQEYGSLEGVVANADAIKGVVGENLKKTLDWLPTGRQLLTIKTDCDLNGWVPELPAMDSIATGDENTRALAAFYDKYGFKGLARAIGGESGAGAAGVKAGSAKRSEAGANPGSLGKSPREPGLFDEPDGADPAVSGVTTLAYDTILTWEEFERWLALVQAADLVAVDTETTSLDEMRAEIVGLSFSVTPGEAAYIPLAHNYPDAPAQLPRDEVLARLKPWLEDAGRMKLGQHIKYDRHVFANHGIEVQGYAHDTMLQSYVLEVHKPHGLASLAERHLGRSGINYEDLCGKGANQIPFAQVNIARAAEYSCEDSDQTLDVHRVLWPRLQASYPYAGDNRNQDVSAFPHLPSLLGIYELEIASSGVLIDAPTLAAQSHELGQRILQLEKEAHELAGQIFNLSSPKQIGEIFFTKLGLPVVKKTATGAPSTDEEVLEKLAEDYPLPAKILEHRGLAKLKGTSAHRPRAHALCAGSGRDRAAVQQRAQPAEHSGAHPRGAPCARGFCGAAGLRDCQRRLQPDRAAHHGAH
jgi:DNA polymerase-1